MKNIIYVCILVICISSCKQENTESKEVATDTETMVVNNESLNGTWELVSYYNYDDDEVTDTIISNSNNRQVKMYINNKVMWSRLVPRDSTEFFGYGTYEITDSTLTETLEYGSASMLKIIDTMRVFSFELIMKPNSFSQIEIGPEGNRVFSENYVRKQ